MAEVIGEQDKLIDFTVALDKLDKIGKAKVIEEMCSKGIPQMAIDTIEPLFTLSGDFGKQLTVLKELLKESSVGQEGISELDFINTAIEDLGLLRRSVYFFPVGSFTRSHFGLGTRSFFVIVSSSCIHRSNGIAKISNNGWLMPQLGKWKKDLKQQLDLLQVVLLIDIIFL